MMCDFISVTLVVAGMHANPIFLLGIGVGLPWYYIGGKTAQHFFELGDMQAMDGWGEVFWHFAV